MSKEKKSMSIQELKKEIAGLPDNAEIIFGTGDLSFNRVKCRGDDLYQIEFNEIYEITNE